MRRLILVAIAANIAACGGSSTAPTTPTPPVTTTPVSTASVSMLNVAFSPASIQVAAAAVVTFTNNDGFAHNVTFDNAAIGTTGNYNSGAKTLTMPAVAGTYAYKCTLHASMTGTVTVK